MTTKAENQAKMVDVFEKLLLERGYHGATTSAIAMQAGVNESTVIRHFKNKAGLLEALVHKYNVEIDKIDIEYSLVGDLEADLDKMATVYLAEIRKHQSIIITGMQEGENFPEIQAAMQNLGDRFHEIAGQYFTKLQTNGELKKSQDIDSIMRQFVWLILGYFYSKTLFKSNWLSTSDDVFVNTTIKQFVVGLK